jgi:hypothetical protein
MIRATLASVAAVLFVLAAPAAAQTYGTPTLSVSDTTPVPGQTITISGTNWPANATDVITFASDPVTIATATNSATGDFSTSGTIPADATAGTHTITATSGSTSMSVEVTVSSTGAGTLTRTGTSSSIPLARIGISLVAAGGIAVAAARRRRKRVAEPVRERVDA